MVRGEKLYQLVELNLGRIREVKRILVELLGKSFQTLEELTVNVLKRLRVEVSPPNLYLAIPTITSIIEDFYLQEMLEYRLEVKGLSLRFKKQ